MGIITLGAITITYIESYNPVSLKRRGSKHLCLGNVTVKQDFGISVADADIDISGVELTATLLLVEAAISAASNPAITITDQWSNSYTGTIMEFSRSPMKGSSLFSKYKMTIWRET